MKKIGIFRGITVILLCITIIGLFLPYEKSIGEHREYLTSNPDEIYAKEVDFKNKDVVNISILENYKVYTNLMSDSSQSNYVKDESVINFVIITVLILSILMIFLFIMFKKNKLAITFDIIMLLCSLAMNYDIVSRGVIPSSKYTYGISYYLYGVIAICIFVCIVCSILKDKVVVKVVDNKENNN